MYNELNEQNNFIMYTTDDGQVDIEVRLEDENVWLTQNSMAELFDTTKQNISLHIKNIFEEKELEENSVVKECLTTAKDGKNYKTKFYKNEQTRKFFKKVQNKMHYAVHSNTAAEVIFNRVDSKKENIGLTNFKGNMPTRAETEIAKNYLSEKELDLLNRMVSAYLDVAEINALNMHAMTMKEWVKELDGFLTMTHIDILEGAGTISHEKALEKAHKEYDKYMKSHLTQAEKDYLEIMGEDIKKLK